MRIRYAYKLTNANGDTSFVVLSHIKSAEEVKEELTAKGSDVVEVVFHERVRTGFRLNAQGELEPTGLSKAATAEAPAPAPAASEAPKAKPSKKSKK